MSKKLNSRPRGGIIGALDIGTTKMCCFIARVEDKVPHIIGIGHQISRGIKNGVVNDIEAARQAIMTTVHAAEQMAGHQLTEAVVNLSGGFAASRLVKTEIGLNGREVNDGNMRRVLDAGFRVKEPAERTVIHSVPVGFAIDGGRSIRDPRGMYGHKLAVNMHIVTAESAAVRNLANCLGRCRLEIAALVASPYASGLACLVEDESELGVTVIDMGGGTTSIAVFFDNNLVFTDSVPVGGSHVTHDIARGLTTPIAQAERMKALYGSAIASSSDERETITVPLVGEEDEGHANHVPKSLLVGIIAPRLEETFELVRDRLDASGFDKIAGRRVVLTGGASQLPGTRELAGFILDKQIRIGRPLRIEGAAEATGGPAFATSAGLIHFALAERAEPAKRVRARPDESAGLMNRLGSWVRENL
ncbi:MAG TPA: cell division protein FtsA [Stellaceae bacterium]|jgi:cell division protein FtsA|nr:cell division protein FtsA [Stellaceae bacterium]